MKNKLLTSIILLSITAYGGLLLNDASKLGFAQVFGLIALLIFWWQIVLGFRGTARWFTKDLVSLNSIHTKLGSYGVPFIFAHYGMILASGVYGLDLILSTDFSNPIVVGIKYGSIAFFLAFVIWLTSAFLRKKLSWDWWKRIHLFAYVVFVFALVHSGEIGTNLNSNDFLRWVWYFQAVTFGIIVFWRVAQWMGLFKVVYKVDMIETVARDVKQITLVPVTKAGSLKPKPGQFAYLQYARFKQAHPFTVSHYDEDSRAISFTIKASGDYTKALHADLERGDEVYVDGPYGTFTQTLDNAARDAILIAGGIGITPYLSNLARKNIEHLFWGVQTTEDVAYWRDITRSKTPTTVVLSNEERKGYESGYVTIDLIEQKLKHTPESYDYYLCGPPPMVEAIKSALESANIPEKQIYTERFSL